MGDIIMAKVLIADDSIVMQTILQYMVEKTGNKVVGAAKHGMEAVEMYSSLQPDLVVLDIVMKGSDGITALKEIKRLSPDAKVIMVSAAGQDSELMEARLNRADGFLQKPFIFDALTEEIARVLG
jgi:two-component system, chemotaxis family, chemotaxis protein CheY